MDTNEKVKSILTEQLDISDDIRDSANIQDDLGADSLDVVDIVMSIEEEFDIEVPDEDVAALKTVADIVSYIDAKVG
ncbi:MAG: acyl carrier protein [Ruminococcus sp.]|jgi:acyl carrier protein|nr:acyl carrier protein [Ruminococcus sp.]